MCIRDRYNKVYGCQTQKLIIFQCLQHNKAFTPTPHNKSNLPSHDVNVKYHLFPGTENVKLIKTRDKCKKARLSLKNYTQKRQTNS